MTCVCTGGRVGRLRTAHPVAQAAAHLMAHSIRSRLPSEPRVCIGAALARSSYCDGAPHSPMMRRLSSLGFSPSVLSLCFRVRYV